MNKVISFCKIGIFEIGRSWNKKLSTPPSSTVKIKSHLIVDFLRKTCLKKAPLPQGTMEKQVFGEEYIDAVA